MKNEKHGMILSCLHSESYDTPSFFRYLIERIMEYHKIENEYILSDSRISEKSIFFQNE
jgi:hypothetical protein